MGYLRDWAVAIVLLLLIFIFWLGFSILMSPVLLPVLIVSFFKEKSMLFGTTIYWKSWVSNMVVGGNQGTNTVLGGNRDVAISSRVGYRARGGNTIAMKMESVIDALFFWQERHCKISIEKDEVHNKNWGGF